uniref:NADH-ubiquinone oxidoreductase chain 4L n=1 Tax=Lepidogalaxias salamandroides TaxID=89578 RepID=F1AWF8_9TELE|nr:NADH dehydrogenase subunit 4L [Lepidogalaxias salamandroides]
MTLIHLTFSLTFTLALMGLMLHNTHLLPALLCLEAMMLSLFIALTLWAIQFNVTNSSIIPLLLLAFSACEASIGLALLVSTTRTHGTAHLQNLNLL